MCLSTVVGYKLCAVVNMHCCVHLKFRISKTKQFFLFLYNSVGLSSISAIFSLHHSLLEPFLSRHGIYDPTLHSNIVPNNFLHSDFVSASFQSASYLSRLWPFIPMWWACDAEKRNRKYSKAPFTYIAGPRTEMYKLDNQQKLLLLSFPLSFLAYFMTTSNDFMIFHLFLCLVHRYGRIALPEIYHSNQSSSRGISIDMLNV